MEENQTAHSSRWILAATCSALVLLLVTGGVFAMRDQLLAEARADAREQAKEREKLNRRVDTLQSALDALNAQPKPDATALEPINTSLTEANLTIAALTERIEQLEKTAAEKKAEATHVVAIPAIPVAPVTPPAPPPAAEPAPTAPHDAALARELLELIDKKPEAAAVDDTSMVGKINTHLKGLVRIKKADVADPYEQLRHDALREDTAMLIASVERLSPADRAPLEDWLTRAKAAHAAREAQ